MAVDKRVFCAIFKLDLSSFLIRIRSFWFLFLREISAYILEGIVPLFVYTRESLYLRVVGFVCLSDFYGQVCSFSS